MAILLGYFVVVVSTLAVIVTAWIGVAESGETRLHLQRPSAIQQSYDASFMAADSDTPPGAKAKQPHAARNARRAAARLTVRRYEGFHSRVALRGLPPPDAGR